MFGKRTVSTKNLYVMRLANISKIEWDWVEWTEHVSYADGILWALAYRKENEIHGDTYTDFITGTVYPQLDHRSKQGDCVIVGATPLVTKHKRIPVSILNEQLEDLNRQALQSSSKQEVKAHVKRY